MGKIIFNILCLLFVSCPLLAQGELPYMPLEGSSGVVVVENQDKTLPSSIDLSEKFPPAGNQGLGSNTCWAYATTYAYLSFFFFGENPEQFYTQEGYPNYNKIFSPAFTYNLYKNDDSPACLGKNRSREVLEKLLKDGAVSYADFPFPEGDCANAILPEVRAKAKQNAINGFFVQKAGDIHTMKSLLSNGKPILIAMMLDNKFKEIGTSWNVDISPIPLWDSVGDNTEAHAMVVTGYNEKYNAFKVLNSWGHEFGDKGYIWISYDIFKKDNLYYGVYLQENEFGRRDRLEGVAVQPDRNPVKSTEDIYSTWVKKKYYRKYDGLRFALTAFKPKKGFGLIRILNNAGTEELKRFYIEKGQTVNFFIEDKKYGFRFDNSATVRGTNPLTKAMYFTIFKKAIN